MRRPGRSSVAIAAGTVVIVGVTVAVLAVSSGRSPSSDASPAASTSSDATTTIAATAVPESTPPIPVTPAPSTVPVPTTEVPPASTTAVPAPTVPPETLEDFRDGLVAGLRGDVAFLVERLNPATLEIYGADQCRETLQALLDPKTDLTILQVGEPETWNYEVDGFAIAISEAVPIRVERLIAGQRIVQDLHWKLVSGRWTWFSDCGTPLTG